MEYGNEMQRQCRKGEYFDMEMSESAKRARREYKKAWNARNRDKVKQYQRDYWERKADSDRQETADNSGKQVQKC